MASRTPCGLMSHAGAKSGVAGGTRGRKKSQQAMDGRGCVKWRGQGPFVGHYWLQGKEPELLARNIACVSWSVAKSGFLCAYRWDGERELDDQKFVWIG